MTRAILSFIAAVSIASASSAALAQKGKPIAVTVTKDGPHHAKVQAPAGSFCGVDGAALKKVDGTIGLFTTRAHTVKCAPKADGKFSSDTAIPADFLGKLKITPAFTPAKDAGKGKLVVAVADAAGASIEDVTVTMKSPDGATFGAVTEVGAGAFTADVTFPPKQKTFKVHVEVAGADPIEDAEIRTDGSVAATPPPPPPVTPPPPATTGPDTAQPVKPPAKEKPFKIEFGLLGGVGAGSGSVGLNAAVEAGVSYAMKSVGLSALVRGGYERYTTGGKDEQTLTIGVPLSLRIQPNKVWFPYLSVVPELAFDGIVFEGLPGRDVVISPAIGGLAGFEYKFGPLGVFAEAGVRIGKADHGAVKPKLPFFKSGLGVRIAF